MDDITRLMIERACERLIAEYARLVDFGHAARIADLFTADGVWESGDLRMEGREAIRTGFGRREGIARRVSRHVCTNVIIDVLSDDRARGQTYLVNFRYDRRDGDLPGFPVPAGSPKFVGEYHDWYVCTPEGWRFSRRVCSLAFVRPPSR